MKLHDFVLSWNKNHERFTFAIVESPGVERPVSVEIRYPAAKYQLFYSTEQWNKLCDVIDANSHGTMYVVSNEDLFTKGIIEVKLASQNHNYQDRLVIGTLRWIGEEFFPNGNSNDEQ